jgi:ParB-like chromosome segregation protein Spo0J
MTMTGETMRNDYAMVNPKSLRPSGYNPNVLNGDQCRQLFEEIQRQGRLLKPVVCRRGPDGDLIIIDGEHNWEAARMASLTAIPIEVVEVDDFEARRQTFVRNLTGSWHKVRLGRMFADMLARRGLSNRDLAAELGCSEGTVRNTLLYARAADLWCLTSAPRGQIEGFS